MDGKKKKIFILQWIKRPAYILKTAASGFLLLYISSPFLLPGCCAAAVIVNKNHKAYTERKKRKICDEHPL